MNIRKRSLIASSLLVLGFASLTFAPQNLHAIGVQQILYARGGFLANTRGFFTFMYTQFSTIRTGGRVQ